MVEMQQRATEEHGNKMDPRYCWILFFPRPRSWCLASRGAFPRSFSPICRRWVRVVLHVYVIPILVPPPRCGTELSAPWQEGLWCQEQPRAAVGPYWWGPTWGARPRCRGDWGHGHGIPSDAGGACCTQESLGAWLRGVWLWGACVRFWGAFFFCLVLLF